jgi:hypothetical protein
MEISKVPPADSATIRAGNAGVTGQESPAAATSAPAVDRADIRPLDISAALQILIAEVRAGLDLALDAAAAQEPANPFNPVDPLHAARALVEMFLQALPDDASNPPEWSAALIRAETAMQTSMERALGVVSQWREVPPAVVDAVKETRALFSSVLGDDLNNPLWLRPEWMGLGPLWQRFRHRRRNARRRLTDPDYGQGSLDESEEFR